MNPIKNILRKSSRKNNYRLNCLSFATHERAQNAQGFCNIDFYLFWSSVNPLFKKWEEKYAEIPSNMFILPEVINEQMKVPPYVDFDVVLSQSRFGQFQYLEPVAQQLNVPFCHLEHTLPDPRWNLGKLTEFKSMQAPYKIYVTEFQCKEWGDNPENNNTEIINTGIDTDFFSPNELIEKERHVLSIANDFQHRNVFCGYDEWEETTGYSSENSNFPTKLYGHTKGFSKPTNGITHLLDVYRKANVFLDTSFRSTLPTTIIEASSCGLPIVCTKECGKPDKLVEHEVTGFCTNSPAKMKEYCLLLLNDNNLARKMGKAGREKMIKEYNQIDYAKKIEQALRKVVDL